MRAILLTIFLPLCLSIIPQAEYEVLNVCAFDLLAIAGAGSPLVIYRNCGQVEPKIWWVEQPRLVQYPHADPAGYYTLVMYDPSVPEEFQPGYLHWVISNIAGPDIFRGDLSRGTMVAEYLAPGPPNGTGKHNYSFFLYKQQQNEQVIIIPPERPNFNYTSWLRDQKPALLGPVGTNCVRIGINGDNSPTVVDRVKCYPPFTPWLG